MSLQSTKITKQKTRITTQTNTQKHTTQTLANTQGNTPPLSKEESLQYSTTDSEKIIKTELRPSTTIKSSSDINQLLTNSTRYRRNRLGPTTNIGSPQNETRTRLETDSHKAFSDANKWQEIFRQTSEKQRNDQKQFYQIKLTPMHTSNLSVGDNTHEDIESETILFHNVNGIKEEQNWH
jgi:hypothetical protein